MKKRPNMKDVEDIIKNFDFHKVKKIMRIMEWKWHKPGTQYKYHYPNTTRLKAAARRNLMDCLNNEEDSRYYYAGCGGFWAVRMNDALFLYFVVESWDNCD